MTMNEVCGDNRFEVIARAKKHIIKNTNIEVSKDEMKCLDNFLFRCWQMGWLKQYESTSEIPNKCEDAISRQAARKIILDEFEGWPTDEEVAQLKRLTKQINELPPVTPKETVTEFADRCRECGSMLGRRQMKQKTGHWKVVSSGYGDNAYICECSECKDTIWVYKDADRKWNYCPSCGAKMEVSENE